MLLSTYLFLRNMLFFENSLFMLPRQPIKLRESDKSLITVENYSTNISVEIKFYFPLFPYETVEISNFHFSHYKSIETISCHSNQSSHPPGIKNTTFVEGNVLASMPSFSFILLTVSEKKNIVYFSKIYPLCCPVNQLN